MKRKRALAPWRVRWLAGEGITSMRRAEAVAKALLIIEGKSSRLVMVAKQSRRIWSSPEPQDPYLRITMDGDLPHEYLLTESKGLWILAETADAGVVNFNLGLRRREIMHSSPQVTEMLADVESVLNAGRIEWIRWVWLAAFAFPTAFFMFFVAAIPSAITYSRSCSGDCIYTLPDAFTPALWVLLIALAVSLLGTVALALLLRISGPLRIWPERYTRREMLRRIVTMRQSWDVRGALMKAAGYILVAFFSGFGSLLAARIFLFR